MQKLAPRLTAVAAGLVALALTVALTLHFARDEGKPKPPTPSATGVWVILAVDDSAPNPDAGQVIDGRTARQLKAAGKCRVYGTADQSEKARAYVELARHAGGLPAVFVLDRRGKPVAPPAKLPADDANFAALVQPLLEPAPAPAQVVPTGQPGTVETDPATGRKYMLSGGHKRWLDSRPSQGKMKARLPKYGNSYPVFPESEWYELDRRSLFGAEDWVYDQDGHGSCVGNGWTGALRRARVLAGMKDVNLSPGWAYSLINGDRDEGAVISDGIDALKKVGVCTFALVGQEPIYQRQMPKGAKDEAARFRLADAYQCDTWEETVSAVLTGRFVAVYGYEVGNDFERFDRYGVAGHDRGPGNHCNHADGVRKLPDGRWVLDDVNSWNYKWGPFKNGRVYLDKQHLFGGGDQADVCVIRCATADPKEPYEPPVLAP